MSKTYRIQDETTGEQLAEATGRSAATDALMALGLNEHAAIRRLDVADGRRVGCGDLTHGLTITARED